MTKALPDVDALEALPEGHLVQRKAAATDSSDDANNRQQLSHASFNSVAVFVARNALGEFVDTPQSDDESEYEKDGAQDHRVLVEPWLTSLLAPCCASRRNDCMVNSTER